ncbi:MULTISPECIES: hypothetical protein [Roseobacteraceae]|nr:MULTISPECIES: hypothetical protein [Roseobacteraceae]
MIARKRAVANANIVISRYIDVWNAHNIDAVLAVQNGHVQMQKLPKRNE